MVLHENCFRRRLFRLDLLAPPFPIAPFAHCLDAGFDRLCPAVHGQDGMRIGKLAEFLIEKP